MEEDNIEMRAVQAAVLLAEPLVNLLDLFPIERPIVVRNENYFEETVSNYTEIQFREHFRMSRQTFNRLLARIEEFIIVDQKIPVNKKLSFFLWTISKQESFLSAGDRFGFAKSTAHTIFSEMLNIVNQLSHIYIRWPNVEQQTEMSNVFQQRSNGIPGVVGAIDGCHIEIKQPEGNAFDYYNRKGVHSIILQGVCDHKGIFIDTFIGMPGRMHDARVFRLSPLYNRLDELVPHNFHLIGDSAYPLLINLMKPFQDNGHLTRQQIIYNNKLSGIRSIIERSFGLLKGKFRRLKYLDVLSPERASEIVQAACILHNFILLQGNPQDNYILENIEENEGQLINIINNDEPVIVAAENKRQHIVELFNQ